MPDVGAVQPWWRGVRLVDGRTGATRWRAHLFPVSAKASGGQAEVLVAPDLDGDGVREMVIVSVLEGSSQPAIYVDAISGKHGTRLWWWKEDVQAYMPEIGRPQWWGHGPDGWPMLALPLGGERSDRMFRRLQREPVPQSVVHLLEASTGRERHTVLGLASAGFADLDGDGLTDLWGEADGELRAFRGEAAEAWRALGRFDRAARRVVRYRPYVAQWACSARRMPPRGRISPLIRRWTSMATASLMR